MNAVSMFPDNWIDLFVAGKRVGIGLDVATTEGGKSNPSALALVQEVSHDYYARLVLRWKSADPRVTIQALEHAIGITKRAPLSGIAIDSTSERYFAAGVRQHFQGRARIIPVISSESVEWKGESLSYKAFLGNLLVNTFDDGRLGIPQDSWLEKDLRSVQRMRGSFHADVDEDGNHADCFDAIKLGLFVLTADSGIIEACACRIGFDQSERKARLFDKPDHSDDDAPHSNRSPL